MHTAHLWNAQEGVEAVKEGLQEIEGAEGLSCSRLLPSHSVDEVLKCPILVAPITHMHEGMSEPTSK